MKRYAAQLLLVTFVWFCLINGGESMETTLNTEPGIRKIPTHHSVSETIDRLTQLLEQKGVMIFARLDFSSDAAKNGLTMPPEQQLIFGNPKAGTPLMLANPVSALDLPIRVICWQDKDGRTWVAYNEPSYVIKRHVLPERLSDNLAAVVPLIEKAAAE
jgi:uncharacterized protein (DUF302 family)